MMNDTLCPKYLVVGVGTAAGVLYEVRRSSDMAVCGIDIRYQTNDGVTIIDPIKRQWSTAAAANEFLDVMPEFIDGKDHGGFSVMWMTDEYPRPAPLPSFAQPHTDGALQ